jgi:hypothetical protein
MPVTIKGAQLSERLPLQYPLCYLCSSHDHLESIQTSQDSHDLKYVFLSSQRAAPTQEKDAKRNPTCSDNFLITTFHLHKQCWYTTSSGSLKAKQCKDKSSISHFHSRRVTGWTHSMTTTHLRTVTRDSTACLICS